jgi:hypothetical protein
MRREIIRDFRAEERTSGEVLDEYLSRTDEIMASTFEGRAFTGAVELLRDDRLLEALRADVEAILSHPFAEAVSSGERTELRRTALTVRRGMETVLAERRRLSSTLASHMRRHNALRDKELDNALRDCQDALGTWIAGAGVRERGPWRPDVAAVKAKGLRTRWWDPAEHEPPDPLTAFDEDAEVTDLNAIRAQGGPALQELRERVAAVVGSGVSLGALFNNLPDALRRPVEILGLLHVAAEAGVGAGTGREVYAALRHGGERVEFTGPRVALNEVEESEVIGSSEDEGAAL